MMNFIDSISPNYTETDFSQHPAITVQGRQNDPDVDVARWPKNTLRVNSATTQSGMNMRQLEEKCLDFF